MIEIIDTIISASIALLASLISARFISRREHQKTNRLIFEKCYSKIFQMIEYDLFSKEINLKTVRYYGNRIVRILENGNMYYYPSIKIYAERLENASEEKYKQYWEYFSERFSTEYNRVSRSIGVPLRTRVYQLSRKHYKNTMHWFIIYLTSGKEAIIDTISIFILIALLLFLLI